MLTQKQICNVRQTMYLNKTSITQLAKNFKINRSYLSMILNGRMSDPNIEQHLLEWNNKQQKIKTIVV